MRVCPKCKYHDPPIWRNSRYHFNVDVADLDSLDFWGFKELADKLRIHKVAEDGHFAYYLQGGHRVLRKELELLPPGSRKLDDLDKRIFIRLEKHRKREDKRQTRLLGETATMMECNTFDFA